MTLWVKALAATSDSLHSYPGIHTVEEENQLPQAFL